MIEIKTVTIVGATGTMGANVAGIFASFGGAKVYCVGRNIEKVKRTIPKIVKSVRADSITKNLIPADFSMLEQCIADSDFVFESAVESLEIKMELATQIGKVLKSSAVSCTGSSGLSINDLAECYPEHLRSRFFGVHMFNPPYNMPLCEFIPSKYADEDTKIELKDYLKKTLFRTVVELKDSPAFLGNRIGFQFINEALQFAERYKDNGGIDYIDAIIGSFTGRSMSPLVTSDFVGLDIHKAIIDNVYANTNDFAHKTFILPSFAQKLISKGMLGRKTNGGLYQTLGYDNGFKRHMVYDITTGFYRDKIPYVFPFADMMKKYIKEGDYIKAFRQLVNNRSLEAEICLSFLLKYIIYSFYTANEVGYSVTAADDVMAAGFNWCPPLALYQAISSVEDVFGLIQERLPDICEKVNIESLLSGVLPSKYDYRLYFKSGR